MKNKIFAIVCFVISYFSAVCLGLVICATVACGFCAWLLLGYIVCVANIVGYALLGKHKQDKDE